MLKLFFNRIVLCPKCGRISLIQVKRYHSRHPNKEAEFQYRYFFSCKCGEKMGNWPSLASLIFLLRHSRRYGKKFGRRS